ncbi:MAG: GTPase HflX [Candidatus Omnitrophica bacterium]|nr:GTPase HflX [Candidatus Omnitrophota bacterium]
MEKVYLVVIVRKGKKGRNAGDILEEMRELIYSSRGNVIDSMIVRIDSPTPNYFLKKGKLFEIGERIKNLKPNSFITNVELSPVQARNLSTALQCKIVDRTGLILDIFAQHAKSKDGKVQVELAQLTYLLPRLSDIWEKFSRLGGGIGTRGPGEQMLEYDRRKVRRRIAKLHDDLERLKTHRALVRKSRQRKEFTVCSIVGYTNAGKSSLLRRLTGAQVIVEDKLFATLDPITRAFELPHGKRILCTDTVGFLLDLPHSLIKSFHATLEEITETDIVLVVLDCANPEYPLHYEVVQRTLKEINAQTKPQIIALNKVDMIPDEIREGIRRDFPDGIFISAKNGIGIDTLTERIEEGVARGEYKNSVTQKNE